MPASLIALFAVAVLHEPVKELKGPMGRGKIFGVYEAPGKRATLIYSSDSTGGDFPESHIYLQSGTHLWDLGTYRRLKAVTWSKDGKSVTFEALKLKDYGVDDVLRIKYTVGAKRLDKTVIGQEKDEPSG